MRFLRRQNGGLVLTADLQAPPAPYAILSHTWLSGDDEVLFHELSTAQHKPGYRKLEFLVDQAATDGFDYSWADTCCIDKRNAVELQEALNSMFTWYAEAAICYVLLADVPMKPLGESRWVTRGWTLQELVASKNVRFYDQKQRFYGDKISLSYELERSTGIRTIYEDASIPERFKWSLSRQTTKPEDIIYCMLGLMEVRLAPDYGEGVDAARERLLEAIEYEHGRRVGREIRLLILQHHQTTAPPKDGLEKLLDSLYFKGMFSRQDDIDDPYADTCKWLLAHPDYRRWIARKFPFLWLKGKPGAGKSTLMKFAMASTTGSIAFFFHARGKDLQKTVLGMYRSLLWQLLKAHPQLHQCLLHKRLHLEQHWTVKQMQTLLKQAILGLDQPVTYFIDALDESDTEDVQNMVDLFVDLASLSSKFSICFASRYYPGLLIHKSVELRLEDQEHHVQDLQAYVRGRLHADAALQNHVIHKAKRIFIWAVLVVAKLNREIATGIPCDLMQKLEIIPAGIDDLLKATLRDMDKHSILALQLIEYATKPISLRMFCQAMTAGLGNTIQSCTGWTLAQQDAFLLYYSRGLAERVETYTRSSKDHVQFIHESVRDSLFRHGGMSLSGKKVTAAEAHNEIKTICFAVLNQGEACQDDQSRMDFADLLDYARCECLQHAHHAIAVSQTAFFRDCVEWTAVRVLGNCKICEFESEAPPCSLLHWLVISAAARCISDACEAGHKIDTSVLRYVHFDLRDESMLDALLHHSSVGVKESFFSYVYVGDATRFDKHLRWLFADGIVLDRHLKDVFLFTAAMWLNGSHIVKRLLDLGADPSVRFQRRGNAFLAACHNHGDLRTLAPLMNYKCKPHSRDEFDRTALMLYAHGADEKKSANLLSALALSSPLLEVLTHEINAVDQDGCTALMHACRHRSKEVINRLIELGADSNMRATSADGTTMLMHACQTDSLEVVDCLIGHGAACSLEMKDAKGMTALMHACGRGSIEVVNRLLELGAGRDLQERDGEGKTVLMFAATGYNNDEVVRRLLELGADRKARDDQGRTAIDHVHFFSSISENVRVLLLDQAQG